jgi:hypothetical protein
MEENSVLNLFIAQEANQCVGGSDTTEQPREATHNVSAEIKVSETRMGPDTRNCLTYESSLYLPCFAGKKVTAARSAGNLNGATKLIRTTALTVLDCLDNRRVMRAKDGHHPGD